MRLATRLDIEYPIIQAPMAGGLDTPTLAAAVSGAGALGFLGAAYLSPDQILAAGQAVRARTSRPFGINLFAPLPTPEPPGDLSLALKRVAPFFTELGLEPPTPPKPSGYSFDEQLHAVLESGGSVFSFIFGSLPAATIAAIKAKGLFAIGTATTVDEALELEREGVDAVIAQGSDAGAHRGTFLADFESSMIGTMSLVPQVADAVSIPVIAAGGIMDGRGIAAALALGASGVQMGTAFLTCDESGAPGAHRDAILNARENQSRVTRAFSGRPARGIVNRFMDEVEKAPSAILPFPLQNSLTRPLRTAAAQQGRAEFLSLWAGQGVRMARRQPASELVRRLVAEAETIISR